jgi:hypothetical protein
MIRTINNVISVTVDPLVSGDVITIVYVEGDTRKVARWRNALGDSPSDVITPSIAVKALQAAAAFIEDALSGALPSNSEAGCDTKRKNTDAV